MKIFLSWSGEQSHKIALALKDWLPKVIQALEPYVSSEDIDKGTQWSNKITKELSACNFGIICVTKENYEKPWILFETGALSKTMDNAYVCPLFFDVSPAEITKNPLLLFQTTIYDKGDIKKLINTINKNNSDKQVKEDVMDATFEKWWSDLDDKFKSIKKEQPDPKKEEKSVNLKDKMLEELLNISRANQKLLHSPFSLFPIDALKEILVFKDLPSQDKSNINLILSLTLSINSGLSSLLSMFNAYKVSNRQVDENLLRTFQSVYNNFMYQQSLIQQLLNNLRSI